MNGKEGEVGREGASLRYDKVVGVDNVGSKVGDADTVILPSVCLVLLPNCEPSARRFAPFWSPKT